MPRKAPDAVTEHRITTGTFERQILTSMALQSKVQTAQSLALLGVVGVGVAGVATAAYAFAQWRLPGAVADLGGKIKTEVQDVLGVQLTKDDGDWEVSQGVGGIAGTGGVLDVAIDASSDGMISARRQAQALAQERGEIATAIRRYCTSGASTYDDAKCWAAHGQKNDFFKRRDAFNARVKEAVDSGIWKSDSFVYFRLGDIDPDNR